MSFAASLVSLALVLGDVQTPVEDPVVDTAAFDAGVQAGQAQYFAGDYLSAARTWRDAARRVALAPEQRGDVVMIHGYLADAYDKAVERGQDPMVVREALAVLDEYAVQFAAAYPGETLTPRVEAIRGRLRERLIASEGREGAAAAESIVLTYRDTPVAIKPWRGLAVGGGALLAGGVAMTAVFAIGLARTKQYEGGYQTGALGCQVNGDSGACGQYYADYRVASGMLLGGLVVAPVLLGAGAAMVLTAIKRKRAAEQSVAPMFARGFVGVGWQGRF